MVLLDTNILVYAANRDSEFHFIALQIREKTVTGETEACVSLQNLTESYSVITSRRVEHPLPPELAVIELNKYFENEKIKKIYFDEVGFRILGDLIRKYKLIAQSIYDLQIVATMLAHGVTKIITANESDFQEIFEVEVQNPFR